VQGQDSAPPGVSAGLIDDSITHVLVWNSDGTCSEVDAESARGVNTWRADPDDYEIIFASSDGKALFIDPCTTTENGAFGKLTVWNPDTGATGLGPVYAFIVRTQTFLTSCIRVIAEPNDSTYAVVVNPADETPLAYYIVVCDYADGTSHVFVTTDKYEEDGERKLQNLPNVTGEDTVACS
jgi:WD40 repeat protein